MSALFLDGFDHYGTGAAGIANMLDGVWASVTSGPFTVGTPTWGAPRTGIGCLKMSGQLATARLVIANSPSVMFMSFGFAVDSLPTDNLTRLHDVRSASNTIQHTLRLESNGGLSLYSGPAGTTLVATTAGPVIRAQTWHFVEVCIDYSTGTYTLRVDDSEASNTPVLTASISTGLHNSQIAFGRDSAGNSFVAYWDDLYIRDNAGTTNNAFLGDRRIATLMVNQDTPISGWTPSYYQKFGAGVLRVAFMSTNSATPTNPNAFVSTAGNTSLDVGSGDFTIESEVRFEQLPATGAYSTIFSRWDAVNNRRSYRFVLGGASFNSSSLQFDYTTDGTSTTLHTPIVFPWTPDINRWYHIALVRASNELLLFVDGSQMGLPIPVSATFFGGGVEPFAVGAEVAAAGAVANTYLTGMYDETRFTNGFARYTTSFSPPVAPFPRGAGSDPQWADVVLLCGYNTAVQDESSFAKVLSVQNGAAQFTVNDGPGIGVFSTINKPIPDDNTFISAALINATNILTMTTQPSNGNTVRVGTKDGSTAATYTFKTAITTAYDVLIDTSAQNTLINLQSAINATAGVGTKYGTGTLANFDVVATQLPAGQLQVEALIAGTTGNTIVSTATGTAATWPTTTLTGGADIPGPSDFKVQRPPINTTVISAIQSTVRAYKSDAGTCVLQNAIVGPLGGVLTGATHSLATNAGYYLDIVETDPDTGVQITPATLINGKLRINRTA